ncbi:protein of unknown function DUF1680 [Coriobacterium glomerans PW2]|uniref:Glycoside hydrolase family 127 protein n=1 Tax=Coriobacterium glomerans (strain ATCC 49209 / DSM 20642 / JCM 10262 / PW2) TaxID=700015 RepID=F2NAY4_CORGP|nr:beta-L-arabinofuranosidase domain-containing protein [Coriobacterium glomerans]AEB07662.1 protein of unknown function DUF1680 [Coriobacterium glomerans PW2]
MKTDEELVQEDIASLYLGNLRTVEFDLDLPSEGKNGSRIEWTVDDDRFLKPDGTVVRPSYGRGDRVVRLTGTLTRGSHRENKTFEVKILEERNKIDVKTVFPIELHHEPGETFYMPQAVAVETALGELLPQYVVWDGGEKRHYEVPGLYEITGHIDASDVPVRGSVVVEPGVTITSMRSKKMRPINLTCVRLAPGTPAAAAQQRRLSFLKQVDDDQMLINFRRAAHMDTKGAPEMIGWDTPDSNLRGHTTGHYLSALALAWAATGDETVHSKLSYMVHSLGEVQAAFRGQPGIHEGFLSAYDESQFDLLERYTPYPEIWAPYYTLHKILAGLLDSYRYAGNRQALEIAIGVGHWVYNRLSQLDPIQLKKMWAMYIAGEFGGMNESLAMLGAITGEESFVKAARFFDNDKLIFPALQKVDALGTLHANQHIPQVIGALSLYGVTHEESYYQVAEFFWHSVVAHHIYAFGGTGDGEMFQQPCEIAAKIDEFSAESCASYNMIKLTRDLYEYEPTADKMAYCENVLINHILSSTDHEGTGGSTYFMETQPGARKGFDTENSCCHGTGLESQFMYGQSIYYQGEGQLIVALYLASHLKTDDTDVTIDCDFNHPETVRIAIGRLEGKLVLRHPDWSDRMTVSINGAAARIAEKDGYVTVEDSLAPGDEITVRLNPELRLIPTPDDPNRVAIGYGPFVLAALRDETSYQTLDVSDDAALKSLLVKDADSVRFSAGSEIFVPLYTIDDESYEIYFNQR